MTMYYLLVERHENGKWGPAFGDYDREVVKAELQDYRDHGKRRADLAIITAQDSPEALAEALERFREAQAQRELAAVAAKMLRGK